MNPENSSSKSIEEEKRHQERKKKSERGIKKILLEKYSPKIGLAAIKGRKDDTLKNKAA